MIKKKSKCHWNSKYRNEFSWSALTDTDPDSTSLEPLFCSCSFYQRATSRRLPRLSIGWIWHQDTLWPRGAALTNGEAAKDRERQKTKKTAHPTGVGGKSLKASPGQCQFLLRKLKVMSLANDVHIFFFSLSLSSRFVSSVANKFSHVLDGTWRRKT